MTREQIKSKIRMSVTVDRNHIDSLKNADEVIDQIFNEHETAIEILTKANEEEISRHFNECEKYEAQLKAEHKKTRSIVAMLFWEYKKARSDRTSFAKYKLFKKAYTMLKENK